MLDEAHGNLTHTILVKTKVILYFNGWFTDEYLKYGTRI